MASGRFFRTCRSASAPNPMAPHPLFRGLADPAFELPVHFSENPPHVVGLIGCSGHPKLLDLDTEAAVRADAPAARHPHPGAEAGRYDGSGRLGKRESTEEPDRKAAPEILVANDPHPPPAAHVVHKAMRRPQIIQGTCVGSAAPDQPGRIERLPLGAEGITAV